MSSTPQISVLMAVYNAPGHYLELAVTSVLSQTLDDFEFVIVDDGSDSPTRKQLQSFAASDPRVVLHTLSENIGLTRALNIGLELARGSYIARQDADDVSMPNRLETTIAFLEKNPDIAAAGTYAQLIGPAGKPLGMIEPDLRQLNKRNVLVHGSMMFRKACLEQVGGYNESMRLSQDYEVYLRMVRLHAMRLAVVPEPLYALRQHPGSLSSKHMFRQLYFSVLAKTLTLPPRAAWRRKIDFLKFYLGDILITHHLLIKPIVRNFMDNFIKIEFQEKKMGIKPRYVPISACRMCGNTNLVSVLDLGQQHLTGVFPKDGQTADLTKGPLQLVKCHGDSVATCGLLQLRHSYDPGEMYGDNYGYRSGLNASMVAHLRCKVSAILQRAELNPGDLVIDIGSNDCTTLLAYPENLTLVGVDPVGKKFLHHYPSHVALIPALFSSSLIESRFPNQKAKVITSFSMVYDLEEPLDFARQIAALLDPEYGIWVFEQSYMPLMLERMAFDTVCHEHIEYYGIKQIQWMLERSDLKIVDVEFNDVNGGSFSIVAARASARYTPEERVISAAIAREEAMALDTLETFATFSAGIETACNELKQFLATAKQDGKRVCGIGASTKGNVLLQHCGLSEADIEAIGEINPDKFGSLTPGTWIPIVNEVELLASKPDYLLVLPWHFRESFLRSPAYQGQTLVFPLPKLEIVKL